LQIGDLLRRRIRHLSSGEQQRVALGRALIRRPQVLLMDEPLTNLDAKLRGEMRAELKHLHQEHRVTTIYVTHDQVEAMALGDRIAVMNKRRLQQIGAPMEVYRHPANLFVAGFIGTPPMSLIPCDLVRRNGTVHAVSQAFVVELPEHASSAVQEWPGGRKVVVGLRPEAVRLSLQQPSTAISSTPFPATVYAVEPLGDENIVDLRIGTLALQARTAPSLRPATGSSVWVAPVRSEVHVFDPETHEALSYTSTGPERRRRCWRRVDR
jgi:multiple sugar transport system ATP-binding protein